jgi:multicomponent K+:H+ antiporter subunit A
MTFPLILPLTFILVGLTTSLIYGIPYINKRLGVKQIGWLLALFPLAAFLYLLLALSVMKEGSSLSWQSDFPLITVIASSLYYDHLSAVFALLVTGIGVLVLIYSGYYFAGDRGSWRFFSYLLLFMFAMLGLVLAGNLISLFIFWEITSVVSFLLVAYKTKSEQARKGAFKALLITAGGGVALLLGVLMITFVTGTAEIGELLSSGDMLRTSSLYPAILALIALASFTKSAQTPFHIWLPGAMSAPTPASAYLHSATMVKAGIYLLARLNPVLGQTEAWFWIFSGIGLITMLTGAYLGLKQNDLKALLAYSTISQLGVMVLLIGQDTSIAFKALVISVIAHALYKSALFLVAGIVDHETGTRDLRRLGGLKSWMPYTTSIAILAALSMAGLPPLFGFLAKETLLATAVHPTLPAIIALIFPAAAVVAGGLILAQAGMFVWDTFFGQQGDPAIKPHEAPWGMLAAPFIPATLSLLFGLLPEPERLASFLAQAASTAFGGPVKVSLALWAGLTVPFLLSIFAVSGGLLIFAFRSQVRDFQNRIAPNLTLDAVFDFVLKAIDFLGLQVIRLQGGQLRIYITTMLASLVILVLIFAGLPEFSGQIFNKQSLISPGFTISTLRIFALLVIIGAALASVLIRRDFVAVLALGAMGLSVAVLMVLEPAPDVALVQIIVDILAVVILVLALARLPRAQRELARKLTFKQSRIGLIRDLVVSALVGAVVVWITFNALISRPRQSVVTPYYENNAKLLTGAKDIVGAIVVDFRALDTLIEIAVFSIAGLGIYTLLLYASRWAGDQMEDDYFPPGTNTRTTGIGGEPTSSFIHALAYISLPFSMILAAIHNIYGHDQPGDGFTAGVIMGLAVAFWYVVFGYQLVKRRLKWLKPMPFIANGILLAILTGIVGGAFKGSFLANADIGATLGIPLPAGFNLSTSLLYEVAIFLSVLGSISFMLSALGHPRTGDRRSRRDIDSLSSQSKGLSNRGSVIEASAQLSEMNESQEKSNAQGLEE